MQQLQLLVIFSQFTLPTQLRVLLMTDKHNWKMIDAGFTFSF